MYTVALLLERALNELDADQIVALHEGLDEPVEYRLLIPVESTSAALASSLGALGSAEFAPVIEPETLAAAAEEVRRTGQAELDASAELLRARGQHVLPTLTEEDPVRALIDMVKSSNAAEAIILTEPHLVREFFGLDWTARAKRHLDVPTLHLLEHVPFSGQA